MNRHGCPVNDESCVVIKSSSKFPYLNCIEIGKRVLGSWFRDVNIDVTQVFLVDSSDQ